MSNFHVGQKVVCVVDMVAENWQPIIDLREVLPTKNAVYTVRTIEVDPTHGACLRFYEILNREFRDRGDGSKAECGFSGFGFRPVAEKSDAIEQFRQMCRDAEAGRLVDA